ncbi:hypothetical protein Tco_1070417 [Tanacetum coccineum]|uniref:Uncharacterized protein n=1 Tax=Tanacetum coccineum TaxID=301880 RepID=A0ABQ5HLA9_9ASTR
MNQIPVIMSTISSCRRMQSSILARMSLRRGSTEVHEFLFLPSKASLNIIYILTLNYTWFSKVANNADEFFCREMSRYVALCFLIPSMLVYDIATILRMLGVEHRTIDFDMDHAKLEESDDGQLMDPQGAFNKNRCGA